jgi:gluconolactonase
MSESDITVVAKGLRFPEGPIALTDGSFLVGDLEPRRVARVAADGTLSTVAKIDGAPNGMAMGPGGHCYIANNGGIAFVENKDGTLSVAAVSRPADYISGSIDRVDLATGKVQRLYERSDKALLSAPNDLVFDATGGFWFTDTGKGRERSALRGALCYARADGSSCVEAAFPLVMPNGVGLSPDESRVYVAETATARIWAFDLQAPGRIRRANFPSAHGGSMLYASPTYLAYDSLAVDADGNICVGTLIDGSISVISPQGKLIERVPMPDRFPTNICFGGPGLRTAYITLGSTGRLVSVPWPRPGLALNFLNK